MSMYKVHVFHILLNQHITQSAGAAEYTDFFSAEIRTPSNECRMTLNNLMVRFQLWLSFGGMQTTPSLPSLPYPLRPGVVGPDMVLSIV